jgi:hypothetical protein
MDDAPASSVSNFMESHPAARVRQSFVARIAIKNLNRDARGAAPICGDWPIPSIELGLAYAFWFRLGLVGARPAYARSVSLFHGRMKEMVLLISPAW